MINQEKTDKNKIYSLHKPYTQCIAKGKTKNPYEFGNKAGIMTAAKSLVITAEPFAPGILFTNQCILERLGLEFEELDGKSHFLALQKMASSGLSIGRNLFYKPKETANSGNSRFVRSN